MPDKLPGEIVRITLNDATYRGTGVAITPTYVNYFFGNNGTGKTTIAKAIKSSSGVAYAPGKTAADYLPLVYDQDFIDSNMRNYHNLPGVFTMNEANVKIQEQIDGTKQRICALYSKRLRRARKGQSKNLPKR